MSADLLEPGVPATAQFELTELLGEGSYGQVWRARHVKKGTEVAIKIVHFDTEKDLAVMMKVVFCLSYWVLGVGCWVLGVGCWVLGVGFGCWVWVLGVVLGVGYWVCWVWV